MWDASFWFASRSVVTLSVNGHQKHNDAPCVRNWMARHELNPTVDLGHVAETNQISTDSLAHYFPYPSTEPGI